MHEFCCATSVRMKRPSASSTLLYYFEMLWGGCRFFFLCREEGSYKTLSIWERALLRYKVKHEVQPISPTPRISTQSLGSLVQWFRTWGSGPPPQGVTRYICGVETRFKLQGVKNLPRRFQLSSIFWTFSNLCFRKMLDNSTSLGLKQLFK